MKRILSLALSCILLAGCAGPGGASQNGKDTDTGEGKKAAPMSCTLSEPVYPEFPQQPRMPDGGDQEALQAYLDASLMERSLSGRTWPVSRRPGGPPGGEPRSH